MRHLVLLIGLAVSACTHDVPAHRGTIRCLHHLHGLRRESCRHQAACNAAGKRSIAMNRFAATAQDGRVAGFQAERSRIDRDVRARLVDDPNDTQGDPHPADLDAARLGAQVGDFANRIRK
jgi:hypothetical protein